MIMARVGGRAVSRFSARPLPAAALLLAALLLVAPAAADPAPAAYRLLAAEILTGLRIAEGDAPGGARRSIAVQPFDAERIPVARAQAREFNNEFLAALVAAAGTRYRIVTRDELRQVIREITEIGVFQSAADGLVAALVNNARVDILLIGRIRRAADEVRLSYRAVRVADGTILAATASRRVAAAASEDAGLPLDQGLDAAARLFAGQAGDMAVLRLGPVWFAPGGIETPFGRYVKQRVSDALAQAFANALTGRRLVVGRGGEAAPSASPQERPASPPGTYLLTGRYWDFGASLELRLSLRDPGGGAIAWRGRVRAESVPPGLALRPPGDFGRLRDNDGIGPIAFTLSSARGADPVYRIGEKLDLLIRLGEDAWLYCFYRQSDGRWFRIFPNRHHPEARLAGRRLYTVPGDVFPFALEIAPPAGVELVKCFATGRDVASDLPEAVRTTDPAPLPPGMDFRLVEMFRRIAGARVSEASLAITVNR